jgi:hypothetical protein
MHRLSFPCALIAVSVAATEPVRGAVVVSDDFSYPDGALDGRNGGTGGGLNPWGNIGLDVVSGRAVTNAFANPPKYASRTFTNPARRPSSSPSSP